MEKYRKYFNDLSNLKTLVDITDEINLLFESVNLNKLKKILDFFVENNTIQCMSYKRKKYYASTNFLINNNLSIQELFNKNNLESLGNNNIQVKYETDFDSDAICEKSILELFA